MAALRATAIFLALSDAAMTLIEDKAFLNERVRVDGHDFRRCTFTDCQLVFRGEAPFKMDGCMIQDPEWVLEGPAATTIQFLTTAYHSMGEAGVRLIENTFNNIRLNKTPRGKAP